MTPEPTQDADLVRPWWKAKHHPDDCDCNICTPPTQGEPMPESTATTDFDTRLAALDRAIGFYVGRETNPDDVIETAKQFEQYLARTDG